MAHTPKVSIGLPVYNGENYLGETLECLVAQTFEDFDVVIVDNASTDRTAEICKVYADRDPRIRYHRNEHNIGAVPNYNETFKSSQGAYFTWAAHDDLYDPTYLERCVEALDNSPDVVLAHSEMRMIGPTGEPLVYDKATDTYIDKKLAVTLPSEPTGLAESQEPKKRFQDIVLRMYWCTDIFGVIRREALAQTSLHRDYYGSDKVLLAELAMIGRFYHVRESLFSKRCHLEMSHFKGTEERAEWINPTNRQPFAPIHLLRGYTNAALRFGNLTASQRASCVFVVIIKLLRAGFWSRLFSFGPGNPITVPKFLRQLISAIR